MPIFLHEFWGFESRSSRVQSKQSYTLSHLPPLSDHLMPSVSKEVGQLEYLSVPGLLEIRGPFSASTHPQGTDCPSLRQKVSFKTMAKTNKQTNNQFCVCKCVRVHVRARMHSCRYEYHR